MVENPEALATVVKTLRRFVPDFARSLEDGLPGGKNMTLREALFILPNSQRALGELERELAEFNRRHETA